MGVVSIALVMCVKVNKQTYVLTVTMIVSELVLIFRGFKAKIKNRVSFVEL